VRRRSKPNKRKRQRKRKLRNTLCPVHQEQMLYTMTRYGPRFDCPRDDCTVVWWYRDHTTPADKPTRERRRAAHAAIDPLWMEKHIRRSHIYAILVDLFNCQHIGESDIETCDKVIAWARAYKEQYGIVTEPDRLAMVAQEKGLEP